MRKTFILALIMCIVGGVSIYGSLCFLSFYSQQFLRAAVLAFVVAAALFITPLVTKRTSVYFWLVMTPLALFVCSSFGVLAGSYPIERDREPVILIDVLGFWSTTPTEARFVVRAGFKENDSPYKATMERVSYEVYLDGELIGSADSTEKVTIEEKKSWGDWIEVVADSFSQETIAELYDRRIPQGERLFVQVKGSVWLSFGPNSYQKRFEAGWPGGGAVILKDFAD